MLTLLLISINDAVYSAKIEFVNKIGKPILITLYLTPKGWKQFELGQVFTCPVDMGDLGFSHMNLFIVDDLSTIDSVFSSKKNFQKLTSTFVAIAVWEKYLEKMAKPF